MAILSWAFLAFLTSCSSDNSVQSADGLDPDLIGTWVYEGTDVVDVIALGMTNFMLSEGVSLDRVREAVSEFRAFMDALITPPSHTIRFNANGSTEDNYGNRGTWRVEGNILIEGDGTRSTYFIDGDNLTFIYPAESFVEPILEDDNLPNEAVIVLQDIFNEDTNIRLFFKRKG